MNVTIDWWAFVQVFVAALVAATAVVICYALGVRLLVRAGRSPVVAPADFTDAITVMTDKEIARAAKAAAKAARKSPLTDTQKNIAFAGAIASFALAGLAVVGGLLLILLNH